MKVDFSVTPPLANRAFTMNRIITNSEKAVSRSLSSVKEECSAAVKLKGRIVVIYDQGLQFGT